MSEQTDDTTERDEPSRPEKEPKPGSYYYDDSTGYEIYDPAKDDEDETEDDESESIGKRGGASPRPNQKSKI